MQSKSFVAQLRALSPAEFDRLRAWGAENCSQSVLYREPHCVMWLASRERARGREDFARAARGVLKRLSIDASSLRRGRWLALTEDSVVRAECAARAATDEPSGHSPTAAGKPIVAGPRASGVELCCDEEDGARVITTLPPTSLAQEDDVRVITILPNKSLARARCPAKQIERTGADT